MESGKRRHWGTRALLDAPVRETDAALVAEVNAGSGSKLVLKLNKDDGRVWINGHPFQSSAQAGSAILRKFHLLEMQRRKSE